MARTTLEHFQQLHTDHSGETGPQKGEDPRPLSGYAVLIGTYGILCGLLIYALTRRRSRIERMGVWDLVLVGLATQQLCRLITKDSVSSVIRRPFTRFAGAAGEGEVNEEAVGSGVRHALGELVTCPFCAGQWVATGLVAGGIARPDVTRAAVSVLAVAQVNDYLQLGYGALHKLV